MDVAGKQGHDPECRLKKPWASCKTQEEKLRYYQVASHESFCCLPMQTLQNNTALLKVVPRPWQRPGHNSKAKNAKLSLSQQGLQKGRLQCWSTSPCLANSPLKPQRGAASAGGASAASGKGWKIYPIFIHCFIHCWSTVPGLR